MKTRNLILASLTGVALASCTSDDFTGQVAIDELNVHEGVTAIDFGSKAKAPTRATHEESARLLNNQFYVYGTKTLGGTTSAIFDNYLVEYEANSAGSTESNTRDWEYAGKTSKKGATQAVKYWDFSAQKYDFVAVTGLASDEVIKNTTDGLRIKVADANALGNIYVADRVTATPTAKAATSTTPASVAYGNTIELQFRRLGARMRVGFYETLPGYAVKDLVFYYIGAPSGSYEVGVGGAFPKSGSYSVTYNDATNEAVSSFAGADNEMEFTNKFGTLDYTSAASQAGEADKPYIGTDSKPTATPANLFLGTTSADATFAKGTYIIDGESKVSDFKPILPNENNSLTLRLRLDYTLVALDGSGDEIHVRDAYVAVPLKYLQWKPNYSYTYLFKISDASNGYTGAGGGGGTGDGPGRDPDPDNGGGDSDPDVDPTTGEVIPPYVPDPNWPLIPDPDDPDGPGIVDPNAPFVPNPDYPNPDGPEGDQHDPANPVPDPTIPDPENPGEVIPDPENPASMYPITFDAVIIEVDAAETTVYTNVDGTDNSSDTEH